MTHFTQIHSDRGRHVALARDGTLWRQVSADAPMGTAPDWREIGTSALSAKISDFCLGHDGRVVVVLADGTMHEERLHTPGTFRSDEQQWNRVAAPDDPPEPAAPRSTFV